MTDEKGRPGESAPSHNTASETCSHGTHGAPVITRRRVVRLLDELLGGARPSVDCTAAGDWYADCGLNLGVPERERAGAGRWAA